MHNSKNNLKNLNLTNQTPKKFWNEARSLAEPKFVRIQNSEKKFKTPKKHRKNSEWIQKFNRARFRIYEPRIRKKNSKT